MIQKAVELEEADLGLAALEALPGLEQPVLQVVFMAPESGTAGAAVLLLEGVKGLAAGQQGQVDGAALGIITDAAGHVELRFWV